MEDEPGRTPNKAKTEDQDMKDRQSFPMGLIDRKLIFVWRLDLLYLATSIPLIDTARWTHKWTTCKSSDKLVTKQTLAVVI